MKEKLHFCGLSTAIDGALKSSGFSRLGGLVIVFLFLFINVESWGQSVGDYRSNPTVSVGGNFYWTNPLNWEICTDVSPKTWVTATYYPGQISDPQPTYGNVSILEGDDITMDDTHNLPIGFTPSAQMVSLTIYGKLILIGDGGAIPGVLFYLNALVVNVMADTKGKIVFMEKLRLLLPTNAVITVSQDPASTGTQDSYYEGLKVEPPCNNTQQIYIGTIPLAFCEGKGQGLSFEELMNLGGSLGAIIYYLPKDCVSNNILVTGDAIHERIAPLTMKWSVKFHDGVSPIDIPVADNTLSFTLSKTETGFYEIKLTVSQTINGKTTTNVKTLYIVNNYDAVWENEAWKTYQNPFFPLDPTKYVSAYPETSKKVVINGPYETDYYGSFTACSLEVSDGETLTINPYSYVNVYNDIQNFGNVVVEDKGSLVQQVETDTNSGNGTYSIHKKVGGDIPYYSYIYWSSPLKSQNINTVFAENRQNRIYQHFAQNYLDVANYRPLKYPGKLTDGYDDDGNEWGTASGTMTSGKGYIVMAKGSPLTFDPAWKDLLIVNEQNVVFTGSYVHNGTFSTLEVYQDLYNDFPAGTEYVDANLNTNLIGNPYPSAIDLRILVSENSSVLTGTFYFWTHETGLEQAIGTSSYDFSNANYKPVTVDSGGNILPSGSPFKYISSGQGFMANIKNGIASPSNLVFKNNMRVVDNNDTFKRKGLTGMDVLSLQMTDDNGLDRSIYIAFKENGLDTYMDGEDARRLIRGGQADFYSLIPENKTQLAIQTLSSFDENKTVALGMDLNMSGNYQINLKELEGVFAEDQKVYLQDLEEGVLHDFSKGAYTFYSEPGITINDRFVLRFTNTKTTFGTVEAIWEDLKIYPNPSKGLFNITYFDTEPLRIEIYNLSGKQLKKTTGTNQIDLSGYAKGIYFAKIQTETNSVTKKLVVE